MTTPTSEILNKAADLIEERGWTTGEKAAETDLSPWGGGAGASAPVCLEGGILAAMGLSLDEDAGETPGTDLFSCPAYKAVHSYLQMKPHYLVFEWNDAPGRTASEVIEVLRATAVIEAARENSSVTEKVSA